MPPPITTNPIAASAYANRLNIGDHMNRLVTLTNGKKARMQLLASYLAGAWSPGSGARVPLVNPTTEEVIAEVATGGHHLRGAVPLPREGGLFELGPMSVSERRALCGGLATAGSC